jgi:hypothetical protein
MTRTKAKTYWTSKKDSNTGGFSAFIRKSSRNNQTQLSQSKTHNQSVNPSSEDDDDDAVIAQSFDE